MQKIYVRRNWENSPSTNTPLGENNLNAMDYAIDVVDTRVVSLYGYEERASASEQNAKISEQNAKTSEENAKISEQNAKESELLAEEYKNLAFAGTPDGYEELVENVENFDIQTSTTTPLLNTKNGGLRFNEIGGASIQDGTPTPDSPVDIENVVINEIKTCGKNLYNLNSTTSADSSVVIDANDYITLSSNNAEGTSAAFCNYFTKVNSLLKEGTTYAIVVEVAKLSGNGALLALASTNNTSMPDQFSVWTEVSTTGTHILLRKTKNSFENSVLGMRSYFQVPAGVSGSITFRISILEDTTVTTDTFVYHPYKEKSVTLSKPITIRGIGEVQDQIVKQDGAWGVIRNVGEATYNGSESWKTSARSDGSTYYTYLHSAYSGISASGTELLSNIGVSSSCYSQGEGAQIYNSQVNAYAENYNTSDVSLWTSYLAENPLTIVYKLATPTFEKLSTEDQIALNSLETFDGVTNIVFDSTVEPSFEVEYGMSSASAYTLKALNDSEVNALAIETNALAINSKELTNGELYSNIIRGYKYGRTVVLSFHNVTPLALTTYLMNNSGFLDNAHNIYASVNLQIYETYAGVGTLTCNAYNISNCAEDEMYSILYYPSTSTSYAVMSDDETAYISGTITYVATNFDV